MAGRKAGDRQAARESDPVPRGDWDLGKGRPGRDQALPQMSDRDIRRLENMLVEAVGALQRGDMKTYAARDREFYQTIAEQSGNSALIEALARFTLQIQLCGTITNVSPEFAEHTAHGCDDIIQAFMARDTARAAYLVRAHISCAQELILARFPNEIVSR